MGRLSSPNACLNCRRRHLKCDEQLPSCMRCRRANLSCIHGVKLQFRHMRRPPKAGEQEGTWSIANSSEMQDTKRVFIDETNHVIQSYRRTENNELQQSPENDHVAEEEQAATNSSENANIDVLHSSLFSDIENFPTNAYNTLSPSAAVTFNNPPSIFGLPLAANIYNFSEATSPPHVYTGHTTAIPTFTDQQFNEYENHVASHLFSPVTHRSAGQGNQQRENDHESFGYLSNGRLLEHGSSSSDSTVELLPREANLLKFFTQTWGPIFDCLDADATFSKSVLHVALSSFHPLLYAMLAVSALQLSRVSSYPVVAAEHYRSRCSRAIMPILLRQNTQDECGEEALFATYVMLRAYEHMNDNIKDDKQVLFTASLAISADRSRSSLQEVALGRAAFWVHLRQDIHIALLLQCCIRTDYCPCLRREQMLADLDKVSPYSQNAIDCAWANRMVSLLCDIINYAFQKDTRIVDDWLLLGTRLERWSVEKPATFRPFCERERDPGCNRVFPEIWLTSDCHVITFLYYHAAKILLKTYRPDSVSQRELCAPPSSLEYREEVLFHARAICGIVITNPIAQALIIVCHMANISATFFSDEMEQNETIRLLEMAESMTGTPCTRTMKHLREVWARNSGA